MWQFYQNRFKQTNIVTQNKLFVDSLDVLISLICFAQRLTDLVQGLESLPLFVKALTFAEELEEDETNFYSPGRPTLAQSHYVFYPPRVHLKGCFLPNYDTLVCQSSY